MREIIRQKQFKTDMKQIARSGRYKVNDLLLVVESLAKDEALAKRHRDHALTGNWQDFRECHIKPDWLLIYRLETDKLILVRSGSHSDLF